MAFLLILVGLALIISAVMLKRKAAERSAELEEFIRLAVRYEAAVLECTEEKGQKALIIQIRIAEEKRTVVHRCTAPFFGKYSRGDKISVYFIEEMPADRSLIAGDNEAERISRADRLFRLPAAVMGVISVLSGIIFMIIR